MLILLVGRDQIGTAECVNSRTQHLGSALYQINGHSFGASPMLPCWASYEFPGNPARSVSGLKSHYPGFLQLEAAHTDFNVNYSTSKRSKPTKRGRLAFQCSCKSTRITCAVDMPRTATDLEILSRLTIKAGVHAGHPKPTLTQPPPLPPPISTIHRSQHTGTPSAAMQPTPVPPPTSAYRSQCTPALPAPPTNGTNILPSWANLIFEPLTSESSNDSPVAACAARQLKHKAPEHEHALGYSLSVPNLQSLSSLLGAGALQQ